jgi:hypothetical protein
MRCEACQGTGLGSLVIMRHPSAREGDSFLPCPECGGTGVAHCCEPQDYPDQQLTTEQCSR